MADIKNLNEEQTKAIEHGEGPLLIIAGAGTGKTTVVIQRIKHLVLEKKINPSSILALTFTEKAAREMTERVDVALPYGYTQLWISTFHAFCDRILRDEAIHIGLNPAFKLTTEAESMLFLKKNLFQFKLDYFRPLGNPYKFLQGILQHFNRLKDEDITPENYINFAEQYLQESDSNNSESVIESKKILELALAYKTYEDLKVKEGLMDFGDLNANVLMLFRKRPNILKQYQEKFQYILVDEFQDTNYAQNELALLLAGKKQNITVVGDDDQSIYRWRGAAIANIIHFREHYPNTTIVTLTQNYRSSTEILDAAYTLIQNNNPDRLEIKEKINKKLTAVRGKNNTPIEFLFANRVENEAELVKDTIKKMIKERGLQYKDFAILVRANDHAQPFARALERARIPYQFLGPGNLFHQEEIKNLIAYMKVLTNFEDNAAMYRILTMSIFEIEARDISALLIFAQKQHLSLFQVCEQVDDLYINDKTKDRVKMILSFIKKHLDAVPRETAGQILYYFLEDSGLLQQYLSAQLPKEEKQAQNIAKFFERLKTFEASHMDASVFAVNDWIELAMELGESPQAADMDWTDNNAVNILTVHSSKGLEFPVVFLVSLVSQRFPSRDRKEPIPIPDELIKEILPEGDHNLQEERRLFYVGMTRAKDALFLTASHYYGEGKRERKISPFVIETIGESTVNKIIHKKTADQFVQQLSLLDLANDKIQQENDTAEKAQEKSPKTGIPINYISYSQISCFDICPLHYKLKYLLKIPPAPTASQSFGTSIHAILKEIYSQTMQGNDINNMSIEELLKMYWIREGYENKDHMETAFKYAVETVNTFIQANKNKSTNLLQLETPFTFNLGGLKVTGRIDRIDKVADNHIEIIDYKTGRNIPDEKKLRDDLQLSLYALATSRIQDTIFNRPPEDVTLTLWYVESNKKISTKRTQEQLKDIEQKILDKVSTISESNFLCEGSIFCKNCEYKLLCQSFQG